MGLHPFTGCRSAIRKLTRFAAQLCGVVVLVYLVGSGFKLFNQRSITVPGPVNTSNRSRDATNFRDELSAGERGPVMVSIPGGNFLMGDHETYRLVRADLPVHRVALSASIAVSQREISVAAFRQFVEHSNHTIAPGCWHHDNLQAWTFHPEASWSAPGFAQADDHPVTCVNWQDATAYTDWLSGQTGYAYRLPTEAEFEYFLRAGSDGDFGFEGSVSGICRYANVADLDSQMAYGTTDCFDDARYTRSGGSYRPNAFGLYDTHGNVWEWTLDCWHIDYSGEYVYFLSRAPTDGGLWEGGDCDFHMLRGGSWLSSVSNSRTHYRHEDETERRATTNGFRVVRSQ